MFMAITRSVSPALNQCELGYLPRQEIDIAKAESQHRRYEECLRHLGACVISLPASAELPDSMFVEDPAVVVNEVAVMTRMGAASRRGETEALAHILARFRPLRWMSEPATLEGGDVLRVGSTLFVGVSARTNHAGIEQLSEELRPFDYTVKPVAVRGCLHLKSACCALGEKTILANPDWVDTQAFEGLDIVSVPPGEARAANVLAVDNTVVMPAGFPLTAGILEGRGWDVRMLDISELMKAEAGVTCSSVLFESEVASR
jgi:dimethylargininase